MKIPNGFLLKEIAGKNVVVTVGSQIKFSGMLTLNDTGVFLWNLLQNEVTKEDLVEAMCKEYDAQRDVISADVDAFIATLIQNGILEG